MEGIIPDPTMLRTQSNRKPVFGRQSAYDNEQSKYKTTIYRAAMLSAVMCSSHLANWRPFAPGTTNEAPWEEVEACDLGTRERLIIDQ